MKNPLCAFCIGVGVAVILREGVLIGWYPAGGSSTLYPGGSIASISSSLSGRFRSSISTFHLCCISALEVNCRLLPGAGVCMWAARGPTGVVPPGVSPPGVIPLGVSLPIEGVIPPLSRGVMLGVSPPKLGVIPPGVIPGVMLGVSSAAGVTSHRDFLTRVDCVGSSPPLSTRGVVPHDADPGVSAPSEALGVSSHRFRFAAGVVPVPGVAPPAETCAGVASQMRGVEFGFGVASPAGRPGVSSHPVGARGVAADIEPTPSDIFLRGVVEGVSDPFPSDKSTLRLGALIPLVTGPKSEACASPRSIFLLMSRLSDVSS